MPTPPARFTKQLPIMLTAEAYERITARANELGVSYASVARAAIDVGLPVVEADARSVTA